MEHFTHCINGAYTGSNALDQTRIELRYSDYELLLGTVMHTGTRAVASHLKTRHNRAVRDHLKGPQVYYKYIFQRHTRKSVLIHAEHLPVITTLRDPKLVAQSWIKNTNNRFYQDNWEEQWTVWHTLVTQFDAEVINIAKSGLPVVGAHRNPTAIPDEDLPWDKIEFANNLIADAGLIL